MTFSSLTEVRFLHALPVLLNLALYALLPRLAQSSWEQLQEAKEGHQARPSRISYDCSARDKRTTTILLWVLYGFVPFVNLTGILLGSMEDVPWYMQPIVQVRNAAPFYALFWLFVLTTFLLMYQAIHVRLSKRDDDEGRRETDKVLLFSFQNRAIAAATSTTLTLLSSWLSSTTTVALIGSTLTICAAFLVHTWHSTVGTTSFRFQVKAYLVMTSMAIALIAMLLSLVFLLTPLFEDGKAEPEKKDEKADVTAVRLFAVQVMVMSAFASSLPASLVAFTYRFDRHRVSEQGEQARQDVTPSKPVPFATQPTITSLRLPTYTFALRTLIAMQVIGLIVNTVWLPTWYYPTFPTAVAEITDRFPYAFDGWAFASYNVLLIVIPLHAALSCNHATSFKAGFRAFWTYEEVWFTRPKAPIGEHSTSSASPLQDGTPVDGDEENVTEHIPLVSRVS